MAEPSSGIYHFELSSDTFNWRSAIARSIKPFHFCRKTANGNGILEDKSKQQSMVLAVSGQHQLLVDRYNLNQIYKTRKPDRQ